MKPFRIPFFALALGIAFIFAFLLAGPVFAQDELPPAPEETPVVETVPAVEEAAPAEEPLPAEEPPAVPVEEPLPVEEPAAVVSGRGCASLWRSRRGNRAGDRCPG